LQRACQKWRLVISGGYTRALSGNPDRAPGMPDAQGMTSQATSGKVTAPATVESRISAEMRSGTAS
jgi:hypothetical protein